MLINSNANLTSSHVLVGSAEVDVLKARGGGGGSGNSITINVLISNTVEDTTTSVETSNHGIGSSGSGIGPLADNDTFIGDGVENRGVTDRTATAAVRGPGGRATGTSSSSSSPDESIVTATSRGDGGTSLTTGSGSGGSGGSGIGSTGAGATIGGGGTGIGSVIVIVVVVVRGGGGDGKRVIRRGASEGGRVSGIARTGGAAREEATGRAGRWSVRRAGVGGSGSGSGSAASAGSDRRGRRAGGGGGSGRSSEYAFFAKAKAREEDSTVGRHPATAGSGKGTRRAEVVVGLVDLDMAREQAGGGREARNSSFMAVADGTEKSRADVGDSGSGGVEA